MGLWSQRRINERKQQAPITGTETRPRDSHSRNRDRSPTKKQRDLDHWMKRQERARILDEAHHDHLKSPGEVTALTASATLDVQVGDTLRDPKLRPQYLHPSFQQWRTRKGVKGLIATDLT